jgi:peptidoglycan hydrolase CwlO-like protein
MSNYDTTPTLETVMEELEKGFAMMKQQFTAIKAELDQIIARLDKTDRSQSNQDAKIDAFIEDIIEMKRDFKHPV